ncbi:MAG: hypothetical protein PVH77_08590 [Phycisphaerales bacterium]|jgi:hypothetical protein
MTTNQKTFQPSSKLSDLKSLLKKQIGLAQKGNIKEVEVLNEQASSLVKQVKQSGVLESAEFKNQCEHIQKLYQALCLAIATQQAETAEQLKWIRKGKKTIAAYRGNI